MTRVSIFARFPPLTPCPALFFPQQRFYMVVGRGSVVLFADDPLFRLFWRATQPLYTNALLVGWAK